MEPVIVEPVMVEKSVEPAFNEDTYMVDPVIVEPVMVEKSVEPTLREDT